MMKTSLMMTMSMPMTAPFTNSPLTTGSVTLLMSLLTSLLIFEWHFSWLASTVFLIYVGGLMVMFSYFMSIQPNQHIPLTPSTIGFMINLAFSSMMISLPLQPIQLSPPSITMPLHYQYTHILILLASILFLAMIITVYLTKESGALRPFSPLNPN